MPTASRCARRCAHAGLCIDDIPKLQRDPARYLGFVEVHIEQGPVLNEIDLPLGIVTSINGSVRYRRRGDRHGQPRRHHADGPPPRRRHRGGRAGAVSSRSARGACRDLVGTVGMLEVPNGSINVVPGRCRFSLDLRATTNEVRDACVADVRAELARICERRGLHFTLEETMRAARRAQRAGLAAALGARGRSARPAGAPHAQRRRPRRDEAARGDAAGDAVRARR